MGFCRSSRGCDFKIQIEATATYDTATRILTVTLPAGATMNGAGAYDTYFIHGIYNEDPSAEADPSVE